MSKERFIDIALPSDYTKKKKIDFYKAWVYPADGIKTALEESPLAFNTDIERLYLTVEGAAHAAHADYMKSVISETENFGDLSKIAPLMIVILKLTATTNRHDQILSDEIDGYEVDFDPATLSMNVTMKLFEYESYIEYYNVVMHSATTKPEGFENSISIRQVVDLDSGEMVGDVIDHNPGEYEAVSEEAQELDNAFSEEEKEEMLEIMDSMDDDDSSDEE